MKNLKTLATFAKTENRTTPALKSVYFNGTYAIATNLETWIYLEFPCSKPCLIPAQTVLNALKLSDIITIADNKINGIPFENEIDTADFLPNIDLGAEFYTDTMPDLSGITHAMAKADVRYYLNGVCFSPERGAIIATDGHRLAKQNGMTKYDAPESILPCSAVNLCKKLNPSTYTLYEKGFTLQFNGGFLRAKKINGKFPDYQRVIRSQSTNYCTFSGVFLESLKKIAAISLNKMFSGVELDFNNGTMNTSDDGLSFPLGNSSKFNIAPCFNVYYLIDIAAGCLPEDTWGFNGDTDAVTIEGSGRTCVVMPMRI